MEDLDVLVVERLHRSLEPGRGRLDVPFLIGDEPDVETRVGETHEVPGRLRDLERTGGPHAGLGEVAQGDQDPGQVADAQQVRIAGAACQWPVGASLDARFETGGGFTALAPKHPDGAELKVRLDLQERVADVGGKREALDRVADGALVLAGGAMPFA